MHIPDAMRPTVAGLEPNGQSTRIGAGDLVWFSVFLFLGSLAVLYRFYALGFLAAVATLGLGWLTLAYVRRAGLEVWQMLALIALAGYMVLNYGFENLTIHLGGVPVIIGYGLMYASLALAVFSRRHFMISALKEPAVFCLAALLALTSLHLVFDIPSYGIWAVRDASLFLDGIFFVLGLLWASKKGSTIPLLKGLFVIFLLNLTYAFSYPWREQIQSWSPASGVFVRVPILGRYQATYVVLLAGALFCLALGTYVVTWPRWAMVFLAVAQLLGLGIHQYRATYISIAVILILLMLLGEMRKSAILLITICSALVVLVSITSLGIKIPGRFGEVNAAFFQEHIRSLSGASGTPGSHIEARLYWYDEVSKRIRSNMLIGEGFGKPLTHEINNENGSIIRQPHNSHISVLARLGALGLALWVSFHFCIAKRYIHILRKRAHGDAKAYQIVLWFFLLYTILMIVASVQPGFEFATGSIPFYFCMGFALGFMRWGVPREIKENHPRESAAHPW
jgi:O-Antigen ligase